ncbi:MAG: urease accessory protein UreD [Burkholderiales bacterium]|nr:urease accessory protein UreD [Burkholderiales bacterium]
MSWQAQLALHYQRDDDGRTISFDRHSGPLRVLQRLYPEGPGICHHVIVHPPGGVVGGDRLEVQARLDAGTHALITTPGATRFYRSDGASAVQDVRLMLAEGARAEWLPMEAIAYSGCSAENRLDLQLAPGAEALGWDVLALGLPAAGQGFESGRFLQQLELPGVWLERGWIEAEDRALLDGPLGLAGRRVLATMWFAAGSAIDGARRDALLDAARALAERAREAAAGPDPASVPVPAAEGGSATSAAPARAVIAGATSAHAPVVVLRALADRVEPLMALLVQVRAAWRRVAWGLAENPPRIWRT